ncbi:peptidylprolyl isomerase [Sphingomonas sp. 1P06PA]|uniref:peptidylprolyl isomerase n=1 Tax=Sphingomonas sp. 1P06PA TaxID=554121 RepID=UPI0039A5F00D
MFTKLFAVAALISATASSLSAQPARLPQVRLQTSAGPILIELNARAAPITTANFLAYVDEKRFDGTSFYRAAARKDGSGRGLVQGGIRHIIARARAPIAHEPTSKTGLRHIDGTISMARNKPGSAMGDFFVTIGPAPSLDASPGNPGYAAFGRVVGGMDVLKRILALPTYPGGYSKQTMGQTIRDPVRIIAARRIR